MPRLWEVVPAIYQAMRQSLSREFPEHEFTVTRFLRFGSWVGGDRDGHPYVTWQITEQTLILLRNTAIDRHLDWCKKLYDFLSISGRDVVPEGLLTDAVAQAERRWPDFASTLTRVPPHEVYRQWVKLIEWRLRQSRCTAMAEPLLEGAYRDGQELEQDLRAMMTGLQARHGQSALSTEARRWFDLTRVFGLHLTSLDVRQDANRYREVMTDLFQISGECSDFAALEEQERQALLLKTIGRFKEFDEERLAPLTRETLGLFQMLRQALERFGPLCLGGHIVSMTRTPSDLLTVLWLWAVHVRKLP